MILRRVVRSLLTPLGEREKEEALTQGSPLLLSPGGILNPTDGQVGDVQTSGGTGAWCGIPGVW